MMRYLTAGAMVALKPLRVPVRPIHLQIEPTDNCNLNCLMCGRAEVIRHPRMMSLEEFQSIVDQVRPKKITLSGYGEPLLNRALPQMIAYAKVHGASVNTTSNLTLVRNEEQALELVRSGLDLINASIDAATLETYRALRGQDAFEHVLDGIRLLQRVKAQVGSPTPHVRISFVISKVNLHEVAAFIHLAHNLGLDVAFFQMLLLMTIEERRERLIGGVPYDEFRHTLEAGRDLARQLGVRTNLPTLLATLPQTWRKYAPGEMDRRRCILPWFSAYITADGHMRPCCTFAPLPMNLGGSIFEEGFDAVWNSEPYREFRRALRRGDRPTKVCQECVPETLLDIARRSPLSPGFLSDV